MLKDNTAGLKACQRFDDFRLAVVSEGRGGCGLGKRSGCCRTINYGHTVNASFANYLGGCFATLTAIRRYTEFLLDVS
jgi:hypothetical protein